MSPPLSNQQALRHRVRPAPPPAALSSPPFRVLPRARFRVSVPFARPRVSRRLSVFTVPRKSALAYAEVVCNALCTWPRIAPTKSCGVCISPVAVCRTTATCPFIHELSCNHLLSTECPLYIHTTVGPNSSIIRVSHRSCSRSALGHPPHNTCCGVCNWCPHAHPYSPST